MNIRNVFRVKLLMLTFFIFGTVMHPCPRYEMVTLYLYFYTFLFILIQIGMLKLSNTFLTEIVLLMKEADFRVLLDLYNVLDWFFIL